jgi:hypothetical protein
MLTISMLTIGTLTISMLTIGTLTISMLTIRTLTIRTLTIRTLTICRSALGVPTPALPYSCRPVPRGSLFGPAVP